MSDIVIIGTGMAGLGAAHHFHSAGVATKTFDKNGFAGGHTYSHVYEDTGFIFDEGPHVSFSKDPRIQDLLAANVDGKFERMKVTVDNYYHGAWVKHPAQVNLHNLPAELKTRCILDFISASQEKTGRKAERTISKWLISAFGETFATHFPAVYGKKYHTCPAEKMSTVWMGPRLYRPTLEEVIRGAIFEETPDVHYIPNFRYPTEGGFVSYLKPFMEKTEIHLDHEVVEIDPVARSVRFANGAVETYDHLLSSIPLPDLIPMVKGAPDHVRAAAAKLACTQCVTVNIGIARNDFTPAAWTNISMTRTSSSRELSFPHNMSPRTCPPGAGAIQAECYYSEKYRPLTVAPDDLIQPVIDDLKRIGMMREDDEILHADARFIPQCQTSSSISIAKKRCRSSTDGSTRSGSHVPGAMANGATSGPTRPFKSGERGARDILEKIAIGV